MLLRRFKPARRRSPSTAGLRTPCKPATVPYGTRCLACDSGTYLRFPMGWWCARLVLAVLLASMPPLSIAQTSSEIPAAKFSRVKIGGGGYVVDIDISTDGLTRLVRTDVYGGYIWNAETLSWDQLVTSTSMPRTDAVLRN